MKKIFYFLVISFSIVTLGLVILVFLLDYSKVSNQILNSILANEKLFLSSDPVVKKFPFPKIYINDLSVENKFIIKKVKIYFSPLSLITLNPKVSHLLIQDASLIVDDSKFINKINWIKEFKELIPKGYDVQVENIYFISSNNNVLHKVNKLSTRFNNGRYEVKGIIDDNDSIESTIYFNDGQQETNFTLSSTYYSLEFSGLLKQQKIQEGRCKILIKNLANYINNYYYDLDFIFTKIKSNESVMLTFDINFTDELMLVKNLNISSDSMNAKGEFSFSRNNNISNIINLEFSKLSVDSLFAGMSFNNLVDSKQKTLIKFPSTNNSILITAKKVMLHKEELTDVSFIGSIENSIMTLKNFTGKINSGGFFQLYGEVKQNQYRSYFEGKAYLTHSNFNDLLSKLDLENLAVKEVQPICFKSDIKLTPIDYQLQNIKLQLADAKIQGRAYIKAIGDLPRITTQLILMEINLDKSDYPLISLLLKYIKSLNSEIKEQNYLTKFVPINTISYTGDFSLNFRSIILKDQDQPSKLNLVMNVIPGQVSIYNFFYANKEDSLIGNGTVFANTLKPKLDIVISEGEIHLDNKRYDELFQEAREIIEKLKYKKLEISLDAKLQKFLYKDTLIRDIIAKLASKTSFIDISEIRATINDAEFIAKGSILPSPLSTTLVYAYNSFYLPVFSFILGDNLQIPKGFASVRGTFTTNGNSLKDMRDNIYISSEFVAKDVEIVNLSVDGLIAKITQSNYQNSDLVQDIEIATSTGATIFRNIEGKFQFSKDILQFDDCKLNTKILSGDGKAVIKLAEKTFDFNSNLNINDTLDMESINNKFNQKLNLRIYGTYKVPIKVIQFLP